MALEFDFLVVGAGFAGTVLAERLSSQLGKSCLVVERRSHVGGNAYDSRESNGILLHRYGAHYFRTNSNRVREYLSKFTEWHPVDYKILSWTHGQYWQFPINLNTFEQFIGRRSTPDEMERSLQKWRVAVATPRNSEEVIVSRVGVELYEMFLKNYTRKQWGRNPKELDASVCGRIPIRTNRDDRYLSEKFQALPKEGYTKLFERMLAQPKITLLLNTDYRQLVSNGRFGHVIYTGPVDEYFEFCYGPLPYRSICFETETKNCEYFQPALQVNYPNDHEFTRSVEIKHATGQKAPVTTVVREYPESHVAGREPYYPIPAPDAAALYNLYRKRAESERNVSFVGRLATYRYYNMDQVIGMALTEYEKLAAKTA